MFVVVVLQIALEVGILNNDLNSAKSQLIAADANIQGNLNSVNTTLKSRV